MSGPRNRRLTIDDPLAPAAEHRGNATNATTAAAEGSVGASRLRELPLEQIRANPDQPRKRFEETSLVSLADSVRQRAVLQAIIVRPLA